MWDCSKLVQQQRFAGVYVTIAQQLVWDGIIFVRQGTFYREERGKKRKCQFSRTLLGDKSYVDSPVLPSILLTSWPTFHARHCYTNPCLFLPPLPYAALCAVKGVYQGGIFRFKIHIPEDHPSNLAPTVYFDSVVFHPQIDALTGEVNIKKYFPTWYPDKSRLW